MYRPVQNVTYETELLQSGQAAGKGKAPEHIARRFSIKIIETYPV